MACAHREGGAVTGATRQATIPAPRTTRPPIRGSPRLRQENGRRKGLRRPSLAHSGGERSEFHARAELHRPIILLELKEILTGSDIVVGEIFGVVDVNPLVEKLDLIRNVIFRSEEHTSELQSLMRIS